MSIKYVYVTKFRIMQGRMLITSETSGKTVTKIL